MSRRNMNKAFANSFHNKANGGGFGFGAQEEVKGNDVPYALLKGARHNGQLNLSNRHLTAVPEKVWKINTEIPEEAKKGAIADDDNERWWDQVDLRKLILASNQLTEIPDDIKHLPALTVFDAHDNLIEKITEEVGSLKELVKINLSHNKLSVLPKSFCDISSLKSLFLTSNEFVNLPDDIGYLCNIEELDLTGNKLKSLPESFGNLKCLIKLNVSKNEIETLPVGFENLTSLRDLNLSSNKLETLPNGFGKLTSLEILECRYNQIKKFTTFADTARVKQLFLGYNRIQEIDPDVFEKLPYLVSLDLRDNAISILPESLTKLKLLERIDLSNNCLSVLPFVVGNMNLQALTLEGNPLRGIRRDIVARGTHAVLAYLKSRIPVEQITEMEKEHPGNKENDVVTSKSNNINNNVAENKVGSSDQEAVVVKETSKEVIDNYLITTTKVLTHSSGANEIPKNVFLPGAMITEINFSKNTLTTFPSEIGNYASTLKELDLSQNKLQTITPVIGSLSKLTFLNLNHNLLSSLPGDLDQLVHLLEISISYNRFTGIPNILFNLPCLQTILIGNNLISEIDVNGLLKLKTIQTLDLRNNNIARIPPELGNVESLKSLTLDGNSFRNPRPQIMTKGTQFILGYLRDRIPT